MFLQREIILDTETTGLDPHTGDRIVEIGCVEILNSIPSGQTFHVYIDPERDVPEEAFRIHGLSGEFLRGKPRFQDVASDFLAFIGDSRLVIHNAEFDMKFINAELSRCKYPPIAADRITDTLAMARRKHPGASNSLDALCARYKIDNSRRTKHGALLDAEILAEVYAELAGGRQTALALASAEIEVTRIEVAETPMATLRPAELGSFITTQDLIDHGALVEAMGEKALWRKYL